MTKKRADFASIVERCRIDGKAPAVGDSGLCKAHGGYVNTVRRSRGSNRMVEYTTLEDAILKALIGRVNIFIAKGWKPLGGIQVILVDQYFNTRFYQAMIRQVESLIEKQVDK